MPNQPKPFSKCDDGRTSPLDTRDPSGTLPGQPILRASDVDIKVFGILVDHVEPFVQCGDRRGAAACLPGDGVWEAKVAVAQVAMREEVFDAAGQELFLWVEDEHGAELLDDVDGHGDRHLRGSHAKRKMHFRAIDLRIILDMQEGHVARGILLRLSLFCVRFCRCRRPTGEKRSRIIPDNPQKGSAKPGRV